MRQSASRSRIAPSLRAAWVLAVALLTACPATLLGVNGEILDQQISSGKGYTVLRVWGSPYDMGYAHASLMHDEIADGVDQFKDYIGSLYALARLTVANNTVWKPDEIEDELDGMVAALAVLEPAAGIDKIDLKVMNLFSDLGYMDVLCRSHSCWGHLVASPIQTLSTRRLDFSTPVAMANHHVLCVWLPTDGSPAWANLGWPGYVTVITAVNEFGTQASLHDYGSGSGSPITPWLARSVAARYALALVTDPNLAGHADEVFAELQNYNAGTGSFINYYVPQAHGAVITCRRTPTPTFYKLRKPHASYFGGDVLITTNSETDGTYTPSGGEFMANYYQDLEDANETATLDGHWSVMGTSGLHKMSVAYRDRSDMTLWFNGRLDPGYTARVELEWADLDTRRSLTLEVVNGSWGSVDVDPNQPLYEPNQAITLTATPIDGKAFKQWEVYDPNHPGDANYVAVDANHTLALAMNADQHVVAVFKCGSGTAAPLLPIFLMLVGLALYARRRRR